jgi:hypothetical protein
MSENNTIFCDGMFCEEKQTQYGSITKVSFKAAEFKAFLDQHTNDAGYVNVDICKSQKGTLYGKLNTWKKEPQNQQAQQQQPAQQSYQNNFPQQEAPQQAGGMEIPQSQLDPNQQIPF